VADDGDDLALPNREVDAVDRADGLAVGVVLVGDVLEFEQDVADGRGRYRGCAGQRFPTNRRRVPGQGRVACGFCGRVDVQRQVGLVEAEAVEGVDERRDRDAGAPQGVDVGEHVLGRASVGDFATFEQDGVVGQQRLLYLMGDQDDGVGAAPVADRLVSAGGVGEAADNRQRLAAAHGVEVAGRFVEQQEVGPHSEDAREDEALFLPAGEGVGRPVAVEVGQAGDGQRLVDPAVDVGGRDGEVLRAEGHLGGDRGAERFRPRSPGSPSRRPGPSR